MDWVLKDRDQNGNFVTIALPKEMPQAFVCSCGQTALNLVNLLKDSGYRVPEDIAVVGYDDYRFSEMCTPQLTSYQVNSSDMARHVVTRLIRMICGNTITKGNIVVKGHIVKRASI